MEPIKTSRRTVLGLFPAAGLAAAVLGQGNANAAPTSIAGKPGSYTCPPGGVRGSGIVDARATESTQRVAAYLQAMDGSHTLYLHQDDNHHGATFTYDQANGTTSELFNSYGKRPSIVGYDMIWAWNWDAKTFIDPTPQRLAEVRQARDKMASLMVAADAQGSLVTLGAHIPNLVAGGDSWKTTGVTAAALLPGGEANGRLRAALDMIADVALKAKRRNREMVPILFRPYHEMNGQWFWWGPTVLSDEEYKALWQYTVAYLRDTRQVHNLIYIYAPDRTTQTGLGGSREKYLKRYPGDEWVDGLGYDGYDAFVTPMDAFIDSVVVDLRMVTDLAKEKGKFASYSEGGPADLYQLVEDLPADQIAARATWFSTLVAKIKADDKARRIAWFGTWSNDTKTQYWTPWRTATYTSPWYDDFAKVLNDPYVLLAPLKIPVCQVRLDELAPNVALIRPLVLEQTDANTYQVVAAISGVFPVQSAKLSFSVDGGPAVTMKRGSDGLFYGTWRITDHSQHLAVVTVTLTHHGRTATDQARVLVGASKPPVLPVVDDFENYWGMSEYAAGQWALDGGISGVGLVARGSGYALQVKADYSKSWAGVIHNLDATQRDWSRYTGISFWASTTPAAPVTVTLVSGGVAFEATVRTVTAEGGVYRVNFADLTVPSWDTAHQSAKLNPASVERVAFYIGAWPQVPTTLVLDDVTLF